MSSEVTSMKDMLTAWHDAGSPVTSRGSKLTVNPEEMLALCQYLPKRGGQTPTVEKEKPAQVVEIQVVEIKDPIGEAKKLMDRAIEGGVKALEKEKAKITIAKVLRVAALVGVVVLSAGIAVALAKLVIALGINRGTAGLVAPWAFGGIVGAGTAVSLGKHVSNFIQGQNVIQAERLLENLISWRKTMDTKYEFPYRLVALYKGTMDANQSFNQFMYHLRDVRMRQVAEESLEYISAARKTTEGDKVKLVEEVYNIMKDRASYMKFLAATPLEKLEKVMPDLRKEVEG